MTSAALVTASQSLQLMKLMHVLSSIVALFADALGALFGTWCIGRVFGVGAAEEKGDEDLAGDGLVSIPHQVS